MPEAEPAPADAALVEAARGAPAAFYQFRLSPSGTYSIPFASPDFVARLGIDLGEPEETAARFFSRIHPDDLAPMNEAIMASARTLEAFKGEFRFQFPSGADAWIEARSNPRRLPDGSVAWNGVVTDITARKNAEAALRENEERYRSLFAANPQPMWFFDTDSLAFLEVNDAAVTHYGFSRDEFLTMTIADIRPPEELPRLREVVGRVGDGAIDNAGVWKHCKKDGSIILVEITSHAVDYDGRRAEVVLVHDITDRMNAEASLRESEELLRLFVRHAPAALAMFDRDMRYITASLRWLSDYGLGDRDVTGLSHYEVLPEIPERWKETHRRGLAGEVVRAEEDRFVRADGSVQWIRWEIRPWRTNGGDVGGIVIFAEDITKRRDTEEELRESRERFRAMFDVAPVGVAQANPATGRWLSVNPRMCLITGYTEDELLTMRVSEITHPEDRDRDWQLFQDVVKGEAPEYRIEKRYVRKDGSIAWVNVNMVVLRDMVGRPTRTVAMIEDITERKRVEANVVRLHAELKDSLDWQRQIFEGSRDAVFLSDEEGRFVAVNGAATELTGYSREELLAMTIPDLHDEADLAAYRAFHQRILGGEQILSEAPIRRKDGTKVAVEFNNSVVAIGGRRLVHTAGRDITERKKAAETLAASETRYRALFENAAEGIIAIDPGILRIQFFNPALCAMFGYASEEFGRLTPADMHPKEALERVLGEIRTIAGGVSFTSSAIPCLRKDGTVFAADAHGSAIEIAGRKVVLGFFTDVTARVRLEEQLRQAQKMEAIGQLAGGVAHDFNNLLTVISGNTELLLSNSPADDPRRGPLTDIRAAGERAANLTRQLLAFSRKQILEPKLVDVNEVVNGIEKMLRRLIGEDVDILTDLAADPSWVKVDPGQLEQVVMNLSINARDAMPRGGRLTIRTRTLDPKDSVDAEESAGRRARPRVALSISDTGTGIAPEVKAHLFEPFFTTKGVGKGTGLGLATVFGIVKQSGGDVTFQSELGKGATFTVILPSQPAPRRRGASGASLRAVPRGTETVLVVEDEDAVRRIVKIALESAGYLIIEARSGPEALDAVRGHAEAIHLVVTDVVMPEMSGRELAERILKDHPGVRILYMSGYTDDAVMRHGIVESGVAFLQKPFTPLALARKVREVLDGFPSNRISEAKSRIDPTTAE